MRKHFHRCGYLRVITLDARDLGHARRGGSQVLEELCDAKRLAPCLGLAECDVLSAAQKRDLLAARATHLRKEEGGRSWLADAEDPRAVELAELRETLLEERNAIAEENRGRAAEAGGALRRNPRPVAREEEEEEGEFAGVGLSVVLDDELRALRAARLDVLDRALDALDHGRYGDCVRCGSPIGIARLGEAPDTRVCDACAEVALPPEELRIA